LQDQVSTLGTAEAPTVDLSPVTDQIAALGARIDETASAIGTLGERVATLEERPVFTGDVAADAAEAAEAVAAMEEQMRAQEEETARLAAEAEEATRAAEEAIAAAEAEAAAAMAAAEAEAALNELRLAVAEGAPFAGPLADVAAVTDIPDALSAAADSGVASLEDIQAAFPAVAHAALPVALRETAGDSAVDRLTAFVQGQVGGRAVRRAKARIPTPSCPRPGGRVGWRP
jgi:chromosome segregation ATPase